MNPNIGAFIERCVEMIKGEWELSHKISPAVILVREHDDDLEMLAFPIRVDNRHDMKYIFNEFIPDHVRYDQPFCVCVGGMPSVFGHQKDDQVWLRFDCEEGTLYYKLFITGGKNEGSFLYSGNESDEFKMTPDIKCDIYPNPFVVADSCARSPFKRSIFKKSFCKPNYLLN